MPADKRAKISPLIDWVAALERDGLAKLYSYHGSAHVTLLPRLPGDESGPITIWETGLVTAYRQVLEGRSPKALVELDLCLGKPVGRGTVVLPLDAPMLGLLRRAYEEAVGQSQASRACACAAHRAVTG